MKRVLTFLALLLFPLAADARLFHHDSGFPDKGSLSTAQPATLTVGEEKRTYLIQQPDGAGPFPVIILLHGGTETAEQVWKQTSFPTLAAQKHIILIAPQGMNNHWNDGRGDVLGGEPSTAKDLVFLHALITYSISNYHGNPKAVFMVGVSNGGFMTMHYACSGAADLRAAANVISDLPVPESKECHPAHPIPWMSMNGMKDPLIPFEGRAEPAEKRGKTMPALLSADETFRFFADRAGCGKDATETHTGQTIKRVRTGCMDGTSSLQYVFENAGHTWPGGPNGIMAWMLGGSSMDIDSGTVLTDFFLSTLHQ